jgi:GH24 family phage-related lysozyme (muramidase)
MIETLTQRIQRHEGFTPLPKPDAKGMWVVGWGHDLTECQAQQAKDLP